MDNSITSKENKYLIYLFSFLIPVTVLVSVCMFQSIYPFGDKTIMTGDITYQFVDYLAYYKTVFFGNNDFTYTFSKTLGGDMIGFSAYYLFSPFNLILLFVPNKLLPIGILLLILIKCGLCGLSFNYMLNRIYGINRSSLIFSSAYALMGYIVVYFQLYAYFDDLMLLPCIVLGIHNLIRDPKKKMNYIICLFLGIVVNYYIGWMLCLFSALYFIYCLILTTDHVSELKNKIDTIISFLISSAIAGGLSSVVLLPALLSMQGAKNTLSLGLYRTCRFTDLFSALYNSAYKGNISSGLPNIYCSLMVIIFVLLFFLNKKIMKKEKLVTAGILLFLLVNFYINTLNVVWHGFNQPIGFPYRYSFIFSFFLITVAYKEYRNILEGTKATNLFFYIGLFSGYSIFILIRGSEIAGKKEIILSGVISLICVGIVVGLLRKKITARIAFVMLMMVQITDLTINANNAFSFCNFSSLTEYQIFLDKTGSIIDKIKDQDDEFYRIEKYYRRSHNDTMQFDYSGLTHYSSCEKKETIAFMGKMGFRDSGNWAFYNNGSTSFVDSLFGVKYIISQYDTTGKPYQKLFQKEEYTVFKNPYALSLAFGSDEKILKQDYKDDNVFQIQNNIADSVNGKENHIFMEAPVKSTRLINLEEQKKDNYSIYTKKDATKEACIEYEIEIESNQIFNSYFTAPGTQKAQVYIDEINMGSYFDKYRWDIIDMGNQEEGKTIKVKINLLEDSIKLRNAYFYYEDKEALKNWYQQVSESKCKIRKVTSSHLKGEVDLKEDYLVFSIPYEKEWKVYIDGTQVETEKAINMLLTVKVGKGKHSIEMKYVPAGRTAGICIAGVFLLLLAGITIFEKSLLKLNIEEKKKAIDK